MIGLCYVDKGKIIYKKFICETLSYEEEYRIINEFITFVSKNGNPTLFYWSAEEKFLNQALQQRQTNLNSNLNKFVWIDMLDIFINQ